MGVVGGKIDVQERSLARAIAVPPVKKSQVKLSQVKSSTFRALLGRPLDGESNLGWHVPHCPSLQKTNTREQCEANCQVAQNVRQESGVSTIS
jgi:hypothetical protein